MTQIDARMAEHKGEDGMSLQGWSFVVGDDCSPDGNDICAMYPVKEGGGWIKRADVQQLEQRIEKLREALDVISCSRMSPLQYVETAREAVKADNRAALKETAPNQEES